MSLSPDSSLFLPLAITMVLGFGFGFYSVATLLAAQAAVGWQHRGVVTGASQFARNIGGTLGVSIAGAIFAAGVLSVATTALDPNDLLSPPVRAGLSPDQLTALRALIAGSLRSVYLLFVGVAGLATLVAFWLPSGPPREVSEAGAPPEAAATPVT
jgi:hypothetical protein